MGISKHSAALAALTIVLSSASAARADIVTQPNGARVPSDPGCDGGRPTGLLATFACICDTPDVCNIGDPCPSETSCDDGNNATCESRMWHVFNDNTCIPSMHDGIDPREDASLVPETFAPTCALTFTVESRGTARFGNAFGWYNVVDGAPDPSDLHLMLPCDAAPGTSVVLDVRSEPDYRGGEIGFFLLTPEDHASSGSCAGGDCCGTLDRYSRGEGYVYYSERDNNPDHHGADSFIHLLVYDSVISERKFDFAWEDTFDTANNDFTDLVTSVTGVECAGAGRDCDTGMHGACSRGITRCEGGTLTCVPQYTGTSERCDGLDDDCDDLVDEEVTCPDGQVCDDGECVPNCQLTDEFTCLGVRTECDAVSGHCVEPDCRDVDCPAGQVCRDGACRGECDGVVCPVGQTCFLDHCIDPCEGLSCPSGQVCRGGICLPGCNMCDGLACGADEICEAASGDCRGRDCPASCPAGTVCQGASCVDPCEGAVCPRGEVCSMGHCQAVDAPDGGVRPGVDAGVGPIDGAIDAGNGGPRHGGTPGCACRAAPSSERNRPALFALAILALAAWRVRRSRA